MNFDLFPRTVCLVKAGSRAYGIHTPTSDIDVKGVAIPPRPYVLGLDVFEQADKPSHFQDDRVLGLFSEEDRAVIQATKLEGSIYELRKFLKLALDGNPNILDVLFCREEEVLLHTAAGEKLRGHRDFFLSAKAKFTFSGYAVAQLKRINLHRRYLLNPPTHKPTRAEYELPEHTLIPADQLAAAEALVRKKMDSWELDLSKIPDEADRMEIRAQTASVLSEAIAGIRTDISEQDAKWRAAVRAVGLDDNLLVVMERERRYKSAKAEWDSYGEWKRKRNPERAAVEEKYGYDCKHGAHLVRLLRMGYEILTTGKVNVWRGDMDADELRSIRQGAWSYDDLVSYATNLEKKLDEVYASKTYVVPHVPNRHAVNELCADLQESALSSSPS